ncbi:MAG: GreA/GreB family elongation factor [Sedimentisphaeraceae bacterium JB056]
MKKQKDQIYLTKSDRGKLIKMVNDFLSSSSKDKKNLLLLKEEIGRAEIIDAEQIPQKIITMNSTAKLKNIETEEEMFIQLVYPWDADSDDYKISVLSPIGIAVLGYGAGDNVDAIVPAGLRRLKIDQILYQPETNGIYD